MGKRRKSSKEKRDAATARKMKARSNVEGRVVEQARNTLAHREWRKDIENREKEKERNTTAHREWRKDVENREKEQEKDTTAHREWRKDVENREKDKERNTKGHKTWRQNENNRLQENEQYAELRRAKRVKLSSSWDNKLAEFQHRNRQGPTVVCTCCGGLFFPKSVSAHSLTTLQASFPEDLLVKVLGVHTSDLKFCGTCYADIKKAKVPKLCLSNGLAFPPIPEELQDLSQLEERLIAPRLPFMMLRPLGWDRQFGLKGNIVNVPIDVSETEKILPRKMSDCSVVHLALMRRIDYKKPYMFETVRPAKVYNACRYLVSTPLYTHHEVQLSDEWESIHDPIPFNEGTWQTPYDIEDSKDEPMEVDDPDDCPDEADPEQRSEETMLIDDVDLTNQAVKFAPGQNRIPVGLLWDLNAEVLTFPSIYCGQFRNVNPKLTYTDIAKSEARNHDRRACIPQKLLYSFKKSQIQQIVDSITVSLRKKSNFRSVTAGDLLNNEFVAGLQQRNEGFMVLSNIRSSPAYWEARKKELFATIRQLGIPTFFHTVSAMETHWPELIVILKLVLDKVVISEDDAAQFSQAEKTDLVRRDPITCARYFDAKTQDYFNLILKTGAVFTDHCLQDYFMRVEFQHRGSPHLHIFLWLKDAPQYDPDNEFACVKFIDKYITTEKTELSSEFQHHRHTHCCRRVVAGVHVCRFGIPYPPMDFTQILLPLAKEFPVGEKILLKNKLSKIKAELERIEKEKLPNVPYKDFVAAVGLSEHEYIMAIRSGIKRPTVFLKREVESTFLNQYNEKLLTAWRSNIDLQFVLDPYACAKYLSQYISKSYRGMSTLLRKTVAELERGNLSIKNQLKALGSMFVNKSEVSAQEAAYGILGLQLSKFSRDHVFINTGLPEERVLLTKTKEELEKLHPGDTDVVCEGLIDHYSNRSPQLERICLADYSAWFNFKNTGSQGPEPRNGELELFAVDEIQAGQHFIQADGRGIVRKRTFAKVIRFRRYSEKKELLMYQREHVMLYHPWRNESQDLDANFSEVFEKNKSAIFSKCKEFNAFFDAERELGEAFQEEDDNDETQLNDPENDGVGDTDQTLFGEKQDLLHIRERFSLPGILPQEDYENLLNSLNDRQRNYVLHVLHSVTAGCKLYEYLGGGAGVGKSTTVKAIVQVISRLCLARPGSRPDSISVLLCAPTGVAAFNIEGATLHSTFILPFNQKHGNDSAELRPLSEDIRTEIASKLVGIKLIVCDELSMISNQHLLFINERLQQIFRSSEIFGGQSIVFVGDLWQLPPIASGYIFSPMKHSISSLSGTALWDNFRFYELDEVMRQSGDPDFANALKRMATGVMTDDDVQLLRSRQISPTNQPPDGVIWLFFQRDKVKQFNDAALSKNSEPGVVSIATDTIEGKGKLDDDSRKKLLSESRALHFQDAKGLPYDLTLKTSIKYMVTVNIPTGDGLSNGAIGTLRHVTCKEVTTSSTVKRIATTVWLEFPDKRTGAKARASYRGYRPDFVKENWTPIGLVTDTVKNWEGRHVRVVRTQFPLTPAEAITIHKSQSLGFSQMVLTVHTGISRSLLYTGCTRARSSAGLWINGDFLPPRPVPSSNAVYQAYEELRTRPVILSHLPNPAPREYMSSLFFYNVQYLQPHLKDFTTLIRTLRPKIATLVETYTCSNFMFDPIGYSTVHRSDAVKKHSHGMACITTASNSQLLKVTQARVADGHTQLAAISIDGTTVVYGYSSPKATFQALQTCIEDLFETVSVEPTSTVVVGDFNIDMNTSSSNNLRNLMKNLGLTSCLPPICSTTKAGTQIDCVFSGIQGLEAYVSATLSSHHEPVLVFWPERDCTSRSRKETLQNTIEELFKLKLETPAHTTENIKTFDMTPISTYHSVGLVNPLGRNLCFANSAFQALRHYTDLFNSSEPNREGALSAFVGLARTMQLATSAANVSPLLQQMTEYEFNDNQQHDCMEFMECLLNQLHIEATMYTSNPDIVTDTFRIIITERERHEPCGLNINTQQASWRLALELPSTDEPTSLARLLHAFTAARITLPKTCHSCSAKHSMTQVSAFHQLPPVLVIQICRFMDNGDLRLTFVDIPQLLNIELHDSRVVEFKLRSIINYYGSDCRGHYSTTSLTNNTWISYNDSISTTVHNSDIVTTSAYIVFYERQ